jgi:DUF1365 family protein
MDSAIYQGKVFHKRFLPSQHQFSYDIVLFWLNLDEINQLSHTVSGFSNDSWAPVEYRRRDYLGDPQLPLKQVILKKMSELAGSQLTGDIYLLSQLRNFGLFFNPVNFYFLSNSRGKYSHMLAEVSNTPWNEKHYYLVNMDSQQNTPKAFHVSPFNPMDMEYQWQISPPGDRFKLSLECIKDKRHFLASLQLNKKPLNSKSLWRVLKSTPNMTLRTVIGIYWHALRLWLKRTPVYSHPINSQEP